MPIQAAGKGLHLPYSADWGPPVCAVPKHEGMGARSGQNHDNKIALQVSFNPTAVNIMDLLHIFVINNTFFSVLVIIFSNMSYFCLIKRIHFSFIP